MTQRRNRSLDRLKATWSSENDKNAPTAQSQRILTGSHTRKEKPEPVSAPTLPTIPPQVESAAKLSKPKSRPNAKRIYMNVVLDSALEKRLERAVEFFRKSHGKAFGKSAYGRKALLAQLERDGF